MLTTDRIVIYYPHPGVASHNPENALALGQQQDVTGHKLLCRLPDCLEHLHRGRLIINQQRRIVSLRHSDRLYRPRIVDTPRQLAIPGVAVLVLIFVRVHMVESDVGRHSPRRAASPAYVSCRSHQQRLSLVATVGRGG